MRPLPEQERQKRRSLWQFISIIVGQLILMIVCFSCKYWRDHK